MLKRQNAGIMFVTSRGITMMIVELNSTSKTTFMGRGEVYPKSNYFEVY